jgi:hypothetical protein
MISNNVKVPRAELYKRITFFILGCIITASLIWGYNYWSSSTKTRNYLFNAEVIDFTDDVLTVKGLPTNTEFTRETYLIKLTDNIFLKDWKTESELEWGVVNEYKYVVVEYSGHEILKGDSYLKGVNNIYCNVDERIP